MAHPCGLLPTVVQAIVCARDRSYAEQSVGVWVGRDPGEEVAKEVGYRVGKTT